MEGKNGTIRQWPRVLRPREKLMRYGSAKLSDAELLAILLRTGRKGEHALALAQRILRATRQDDSMRFEHISFEQMISLAGIGPAKATQLIACVEFGRRLFTEAAAPTLLLQPVDVWEALADVRAKAKEHIVVFYLDTQQRALQREVVSIGTLTKSLIHPREVFESAIRAHAAEIILAHTHPSGVLIPSEADLQMTARIVDAGILLGIPLRDHVIVTKEGFLSLQAAGYMKEKKELI